MNKFLYLLCLISCSNVSVNHEKFIQKFLESGDLKSSARQYGIELSPLILKSIPENIDSGKTHLADFRNGAKIQSVLKVASAGSSLKDSSIIFLYKSPFNNRTVEFRFEKSALKDEDFRLLYQIDIE